MNKNTKLAILSILVLVAFIAMCVSQTFPRDSLSHYLCWIAAFLSGGYAVRFLFVNFAKE
jgi:hypothetical protein